MTRYPVKDQVAIVGVGSTGFTRHAGARTPASLAVEASVAAVRDAGLGAAAIDGVCGTTPAAHKVAAALGLPEVRWFSNQVPTVGFSLLEAMHAVYAGACDTVLMYHSMYRTPFWSRSAARDPFRRHAGPGAAAAAAGVRSDPEDLFGPMGYPAWASRYIAEFKPKREHFGFVAVNDRTNAGANPLAVRRDPIVMDDYLAAPMVREPLCLLDMDIPVDGGDALVITTAERARDLPHPPVLVHAATAGLVDRNDEAQLPGLQRHGQHVVVDALRERSDIWIPEIDLYFPYDGFTIITLAWIENTGWCQPGEAGPFLEDHWTGDRVLIDGRIPVNPHGGALSEGGTQGSGHVREAIVQLRGEAGDRQLPGAESALVTPGGFFFNALGMIFRTDGEARLG